MGVDFGKREQSTPMVVKRIQAWTEIQRWQCCHEHSSLQLGSQEGPCWVPPGRFELKPAFGAGRRLFLLLLILVKYT